jgi:hypothetical protein
MSKHTSPQTTTIEHSTSYDSRELPDVLVELAGDVLMRGDATGESWFAEHARQLNTLAEQAREQYARLLPANGEIPTSAQGVALARFLRPHLRDGRGCATVCRGAVGLPDSYVYVRLDDGYEGGIDREGRVST